jgi:hypothetical protein
MKKKLQSLEIIILLSLILIPIFVGVVPAQVNESAATVVSTDGFVDVKYAGTNRFVPLTPGKTVGVGDLIQTDTEGEVEIRLPDKSVLKIGSSSQVLIKELGIVEVTKISTSTFELIKGKIRAVVSPLLKKDSRFTIETTNATVGVRGTDFFEEFDPDTEATYVLGLEDCVGLSLKSFPGSVPILICGHHELMLSGRGAPPAPAEASPETIDRILREMELKGETGGAVPEGRKPPYITGVFLNRTIDLERLEGTLVLTKDDLTIDRKIIIGGQARDEDGRVTAVEVSTDGGATFSKALGTESWTYEFSPSEDMEYEIMVRAVNDADLTSDPREFGAWTMAYKNVGNEDIVRSFVNAFINGIRTEDIGSLEEVVSDAYDGTLGGFYSKDEMMSGGIEDLAGQLSGTTITYTIDQVSILGDRIIGVIHWTMVSGATNDQGKTTWWLSRSDDFRLAHAEGDWFLKSIISVEPALTLVVIDNGTTPPCNNSVKILLTAPNIPESVLFVTVQVQTSCGTANVFLDRWYYEMFVGEKNGFGGEAPIEMQSPACVAPTCGPGRNTYLAANPFFTCDFTGYGYSLTADITLP